MQYLDREECKSRQIAILKKIHDISVKNDINYYLAYGSLIGAVRHKGFIPWDDDIDIMVPRNDYKKLINVLKSEQKDDWLSVIDCETQNYFYPFAKAIDNRTIAEEEGMLVSQGIWIDIFPIDGLPNNIFLYKLFSLKCFFYRSIIIAMTTNFSSKKEIEKVKVKRLLNFIAKIFGRQRIFNHYNKYIQKYNINNSKYIGCLSTPYIFKEKFEKEILLKHTLFDFEGNQFYGPSEYDFILKRLYGNYMELPPEEKRKGHNIVAWIK